MPIRKVSNRSKKNTIGHFPSFKMKRMIAFESLIERDGIYTFDFELDVLAFEEQPFSIEYEYEGKKRHYTPDFLLKKPGCSVIVECKPTAFVDSTENRRKFDMARQWCDDHGYHFQVLTDTELRSGFRIENIKLLTRFARQHVEPEMRSRIYARLYSPGSNLTVHSLALHVSPVEPPYPVKREGVIEKASIHWHTVAYANMYRADGRVEAILPE